MIARTDTHLHVLCPIRGRHVRVRKAHVKIALAYGGFAFMALDCLVSIIALHHWEPLAGPLGKVGATMGGAVPFFDNLIRAAVKEA